ncbi:GroES-like protein [Sarocladium strictum]
MGSIYEIPRTHKAAVYDKPGQLSIKVIDQETPVPATGEVLVKLSHSGVCHSDLSLMTNGWQLPFALPDTQIGGHEGAGTIVKMGPETDKYGFKVGDPVGVKWLRDICGTCVFCVAGEDGLCAKQSVSGMFQPGTFQQYVTLPAHYMTPLPRNLSPEIAAPMLCAGLTAYAALRRAGTKPGQWLVVSGAGGGVGHLVVQLAARAFGQRVIGVDQASKEDVIKESGAELFADVANGKDMLGQVKSLTEGLGAHTVIVCAAANAAYAQAVELLRPCGTVVGVGMPDGQQVPIASALPGAIVRNQLKIVGSVLGNRQDAIDVLELAARGIVTLHYQTRGLGELQTVFEEMKASKLSGRVVLDLNR